MAIFALLRILHQLPHRLCVLEPMPLPKSTMGANDKIWAWFLLLGCRVRVLKGNQEGSPNLVGPLWTHTHVKPLGAPTHPHRHTDNTNVLPKQLLI